MGSQTLTCVWSGRLGTTSTTTTDSQTFCRVLFGSVVCVYLGRPRRRWEDNIKMDLQEVGGGFVGTGWSWLRIGTGGGHL
jgi:hypothetical protein